MRSAVGCHPEEVEEKPAPSAFAKACPLAGEAEVLTGKASNHRVKSAVELSTLQGSHVWPDWGGVDKSVPHPGLEDFLGLRLVFAVEDGPGVESKALEGSVEASVEHPGAREERGDSEVMGVVLSCVHHFRVSVEAWAFG